MPLQAGDSLENNGSGSNKLINISPYSQPAIHPYDPEVWQIVDGKLYLNYDNRVQRVWANQLLENVKLADKYWPELESQALNKQKP